jgi:hypothetical protein
VTRPARFRQSDVERLVRGAIKGGWPVGGFQIVVDGGRITLLPVTAREVAMPVNDDVDWVTLAGEAEDSGRA